MASPQTLPNVLVLALSEFTEDMSLDFLKNRVDVTFVTTESEACTNLQSQQFTAILVVDPIIAQAAPSLRRQVTTFARSGGKVILCHFFSSFIRPMDFDRYMQAEWDLPWRFGAYGRTDFYLNPEGVSLCQEPDLQPCYSMKAVSLKSVQPSSRIYQPRETSRIQSHVFPATPIADLSQAAIAFAKVGNGWLGYIGDVNDEADTLTVILAMIGKA
ncbi:hypothetical protein EV426DRAFT_622626 [Tirmania nivea]|nr:hypothetical protein EV426DRAFT_622626 [Tirmania nivea]